MQETIRENEEKELRVLRKNGEREEQVRREYQKKEEQLRKEYQEREEQLRRENKQLEEEQRRKNEECLAVLIEENEAQLANLVARQGEKKERVSRKRKADELERNKKPSAPECPVCLFVCLFVFQLLSQVCLDEMVPPTKIFNCVNGHHICETCK